MIGRRALKALALGIATLAISPAVMAQQDDVEPAIVAPADPVGDAPDPEFNPAAASEPSAYEICMGFYYSAGEDEPSFDFATLEGSCTNVIESGPKRHRASAHYMRSQIRMQDGRNAEAMEDLDAVLELNPRDTYVLQDRASLHSMMGRRDLARTDLMTALKIAPFNANLHNSMCWSLAMEGTDLDRALNYCNISIGLMANNALALDSRGMVYLKMGKLDLALADYKRAMNIFPQSAHFMYGRGIVLLRLDQKDEGAKFIDRAIGVDPTIAKQYEDYGVTP